jgi:hypothetical protein
VYTMVYWTLRGFVCTSWVVRWRGTNVSWVVVVVGASASGLGDRRVLCVKLSDSCHQHTLHQVDTYV